MVVAAVTCLPSLVRPRSRYHVIPATEIQWLVLPWAIRSRIAMRSSMGGWVSNRWWNQLSWCWSGSSMHIAAVAWLNFANGVSFACSFRSAVDETGRVPRQLRTTDVGEFLATA